MTVFAKRDNGKGARASRMVQSGAIFALAATTYLVSPQIAQAQSYRFDQVAIEGNQRIEPRTILTYAGIGRGEAVTAGELNDAYQRLQGSGLFEKVELKPQGGKLVIAVQEFPTVNVVAFEGNDRIKDEILQGLIKTQSRKIYSPAAVEADAALITKGYSDIGRMAATVTPKVIRREGNRVDVAFEITEGKVTEIERLSFTGNRAYSDRRLRNVLNTKQAGFFRALVQRDTLVPERLEYDTQLLTDFYRSRGYVDVKVKGISSDYTRERDAFFVTFNIEEGQSFKFGDVSVISEVEGVDPAEYEKQIKIRSGVTYSPTAVDNVITRMEGVALKQGLNFIAVEPRVVRNERDLTLDVQFVLTRGPKVFVERIDIEGNTTTLDRVIRRQFKTVEGDPFNPREIRNAAERVRALGYFANADVQTKRGNNPDQVVVDVNVEEQPTGSFGIGASYGADQGVGVNLSLAEDNFLGRGQRMAVSIATAGDEQNNSITFVEPYLFGRDLQFGINLQNSKTDNSNAYYQTRVASISPSLTFPISEQGRLSLRYTLKSDKMFNVGTDDNGVDPTDEPEDSDGIYTGSSPILERDEAVGSQLTSGVGYTYSYDTRVNALDPNTNFKFSFGQDFNGLGGDIKSIVTKAEVIGQTKVMQEEVTLTGQLQGGAVTMLNDGRSRLLDRFSGNGLIRGFEAWGYGPRDLGADVQDGLGGNYFISAKMDAQFPIGLPEEYGVTGGLFMDIGSVWGLDDTAGVGGAEVDDSLIWRSSVGFSIYWTTPVGPLRLNFSKALMKEDYDKERNFDLTVSTKF